MAGHTNKNKKETLNQPDHTDDKIFETNSTTDAAKKKQLDEAKERSFKEGLADNSDTDKNSKQQK